MQRETERELGADRIAIRPHVAEKDEGVAGTQHLADLLEGGVCVGIRGFAHGVEPRRGGRILAVKWFRARINLKRKSTASPRIEAFHRKIRIIISGYEDLFLEMTGEAG